MSVFGIVNPQPECALSLMVIAKLSKPDTDRARVPVKRLAVETYAKAIHKMVDEQYEVSYTPGGSRDQDLPDPWTAERLLHLIIDGGRPHP